MTTQNYSGDAFARADQLMGQGGADLARVFTLDAKFDDWMNFKNYP